MRLKKYRKLLGLNIKDAAGQLRVSEVCYRYWESGKKIPSADNMTNIFEWSLGSVQPNDFHHLPDLSKTHNRSAQISRQVGQGNSDVLPGQLAMFPTEASA